MRDAPRRRTAAVAAPARLAGAAGGVEVTLSAARPWARAYAGALIFALPMLMTMEMWSIGFYAHPFRLALLLIVSLPVLLALSWIAGFEPTSTLGDAIIETFAALAVAATMSFALLFLLGILHLGMPLREIVGKLTLQTFAGSFGALLARSQLHASAPRPDRQARSYFATLILMAIGALFLGLNVAPTEEVALLAYSMSPTRELGLLLLSLILMHAFVYVANFRGRPDTINNGQFWMLFFRFTVVGYAVVLLISFYLLWTFGRTDATGLQEVVGACVVLGFPCAIGAAASRLIL